MFDLPWVIGKRVARTASSMAFNVTLLKEVPTGRIDPLLIAHAPEQAFGEGQFSQAWPARHKQIDIIGQCHNAPTHLMLLRDDWRRRGFEA
jgi:hypothetical protein